MNRRLGTIGRVHDAVVSAMAVLAGALLVVATLGVIVDVLARYLLGRPIAWVFEVTEYILLYIPCLGMAWLAREKGHVAIDLVLSRLGGGARGLVEGVNEIVAGAVCAFIAYWGALATWDNYVRWILIENILQVPKAAVLAIIPVGFAMAAIEFFRSARRRLRTDRAAGAARHGGAVAGAAAGIRAHRQRAEG